MDVQLASAAKGLPADRGHCALGVETDDEAIEFYGRFEHHWMDARLLPSCSCSAASGRAQMPVDVFPI
jgi:hypothetical protein